MTLEGPVAGARARKGPARGRLLRMQVGAGSGRGESVTVISWRHCVQGHRGRCDCPPGQLSVLVTARSEGWQHFLWAVLILKPWGEKDLFEPCNTCKSVKDFRRRATEAGLPAASLRSQRWSRSFVFCVSINPHISHFLISLCFCTPCIASIIIALFIPSICWIPLSRSAVCLDKAW